MVLLQLPQTYTHVYPHKNILKSNKVGLRRALVPDSKCAPQEVVLCGNQASQLRGCSCGTEMTDRNRRWRWEVAHYGLREHVRLGENIKIVRARSEESSQYRRKMSVPGSGCDGPWVQADVFWFYHLNDEKLLIKGLEEGSDVWKWLFSREIILELNGLPLRNSWIWVTRLLSFVCSFRVCALYPRPPLHRLGTREKLNSQNPHSRAPVCYQSQQVVLY